MATSSVSSSSASSNTISTNLSTSSRARVNGTSLVSGLDTDTLIKQLTAGTRSKIAQQQQKLQLAQWKRDSYREVTTKLTDFSNKYFSYSATDTNILSSKFFDVATINNPSSLLTVSGSTSAATNMQVGSISQLARQASFTSTKQVANTSIQSGTVMKDWVQSNVQAQSMTLSYGSKTYSISIPQNIVLDPAAADSDKMIAMQQALQKQIDSNADLKGKVTVGVSGNSFSLTNSDTTKEMKITDGTLAESLGFAKGATGTAITGSALDSTAMGKLFVSKTLGDALAGNSLTFNLNGISKTVNFNLTDKAQYSTISGMRTYLQSALDKAYGAGKITVGSLNVAGDGTGATGDFNFTTADTTSVLTVTSSDNTNVLNDTGALKIGAGESNRLELSKTLKQLATPASGVTEISGLTPDADGNYKMKVNGKEFTFSQDTTLSSVMSQINNDDDANVTIAYSSITNTFNVKAKGSGAASTVDFSDVSGNLASSLFGTAGTAAIQSSGAITEGASLQSALSGSTIKVTYNGQQKDVYFDPADAANFTTAADVSTYLQTKLDAEFGAGKVSITNNSGILKFATTDAASTLSIDSSSSSGALSALNITAGSATMNSGNYLITAGQDAKMKVSFDGGTTFTDITRTENNFTLDGVNFSLLGTTDPTKSLADTTIKFTSNSNVDALYTKIKTFIDDYNSAVDLINGKVNEAKEKDPSYDPLSDEQKAQMTDTQITDWNTHAKKGVLQNDSTLNQISNEMRTAMTSLVDGTNLKALSKVGISTSSYDYDPATNGHLIIDETQLRKSLTENASSVADLFTDSTNGIATKLKNVLDANVGTFGGDGTLISLAGKATSLSDQSTLSKNIADYNTAIKDLKTKLSDEQDRYWTKFTAMETQLSNLQSQSDWLYQQSSGS